MAEFEQVYEANQGFIYKFLLNYCRDAVLAEELTQETFFKAYMNFQSLKDRDKAPAWLCQIAKNTYFAWYNEQKRMQPLEDNNVGVAADPEKALYEKECRNAALIALHELKEPYREVLMLHVMDDISLQQISELFGKSESWARVTFYRGKQQLRERMRNQNEL